MTVSGTTLVFVDDLTHNVSSIIISEAYRKYVNLNPIRRKFIIKQDNDPRLTSNIAKFISMGEKSRWFDTG